MQKLIRTTLFAAVLLLFGVSTAPAQSYQILADSASLTPSGGPSDIQCMSRLSSGTFVFFNSNASAIYTWDGSSLTAQTDSTALNSNIDATSNPIDRCDAVEVNDGNVYFSFRASGDQNQPNYIYKTAAADPSTNTFKELDGTLGLAVRDATLYLASYAFFEDTGSREDGIYSIGTDLSGSATAVATNADLSIDGGIDISESGVLYSYSNSFAGGDFAQKVVSLDLTASSPSFQVFADPYASGSPLSSGGENVEDLNAITFNGSEYVVVHNQNSSAPNGEEFGSIKVADQSISLLFTEADLTSNLSVTDYNAAFARAMHADSTGSVYVASGGGGPYYLAEVSGAPPLPVEMAVFDAVTNGSSVELTWQTASETNNAGFRVQHQTESGWTTLGFVESKASGGTTAEALSYRYTVNRELNPGTHRFRLKQEDLDGSTSLSDVVAVEVSMDDMLTLDALAPNPARGHTTLSFRVKEATETTVALYNVLGQRVKTLYQGTPQSGQLNTVDFDVGTLPSGMYFVRMQADGQTHTERLTVVR